MHRYRSAWILLPLALLLFSGCTSLPEYIHNGFKVGPNYHRPGAPVSPRWIDAGDPAILSGGIERDAWWTLFEDPVLNDLILTARFENLSLRAACWRIMQARARLGIVAGELFPQQQQLTANYARRQASENLENQVVDARFFDVWDVGASLSWELDFWGRYRRAVEAASAELNASVAGYHDVLVMLQADVARAYVQIRTQDMRLAAARKNLKIQEDSLDIVRQRHARGVTTELDVSQATVNVEQTRARMRPLEIERRQAANRLCILLAVPPQDLDEALGTSRVIPAAPPQVAIGIPAQLICRRPDVRQAERELAAQAARIGIATSALYPHIAINGNIGFEASEFSDLFDASSVAGSIGPSVQWNILNYGRIANAIHLEDARFREFVEQYRVAVLTAQEEAENSLYAFLRSQQRVKDLSASVQANKRSVELVLQQYQTGLTDFNRVYTLERALGDDEDRLSEAQGAVPQNLILLFRALGGGWRVSSQALATAPPPVDIKTLLEPLVTPPGEPAAPAEAPGESWTQ